MSGLIVAVGDSITAGQHLHPASAWPYQIQGYEIIARGVPGETTRQGLERFPADVQLLTPRAVIIQFGHNDANRWETDRGLQRVSPPAYASNLLEMVLRTRAFDAQPFLCTLTPSRRSATHEADVQHYDLLLRHVAVETEVPLIDVRADFGDDDGLLMEDGLHLTIEGHLRYAACVRRALDEHLG